MWPVRETVHTARKSADLYTRGVQRPRVWPVAKYNRTSMRVLERKRKKTRQT